jgi:GntR family transcriptional regulator
MAPNAATARGVGGKAIVRGRLLASLHVGRLRPGDRVPSVRRLADLTGLNRKTIHRAYKALAREGLLDTRPGSGTFVAGRDGAPDTAASSRNLVSAIERMRAAAAALNLEPAVFASFVQAALGNGLAGTRVAVVECNHEQAGMIETDLARRLGVAPFRVLLGRLRTEGARILGGARAVVTTDCHLDEVAKRTAPSGLPVHPVSLDASFPRLMIDLGRRHRVILVVRDPVFGPVFFRLLRELGLEEAAVKGFGLVTASGARDALAGAPEGAHVWFSPLVRENPSCSVPRHVRVVRDSWHVPRDSLDRVRADLAFDHACREIAAS